MIRQRQTTSPADVERLWWLSLGIFGAVVGVVAGLLGLIVGAARSIDQRAQEIWTVGKQIAGNTVSIWMLQDTNAGIKKLTEAARSIDRSTSSMDEALQRLTGSADRRS